MAKLIPQPIRTGPDEAEVAQELAEKEKVPPVPENLPSIEAQRDQAAHIILMWLGSLDTRWATNIQVAREERHWNDLQIIGQLASYTLDQNAHLIVPQHPAFEIGGSRGGGTGSMLACPHCEKPFIARYAGQPYCSNACAIAARSGVAPVPATTISTSLEKTLTQREAEMLAQSPLAGLGKPTVTI